MLLLAKYEIHALSHITGGGVIENLPRSLNEGQAVYWDLADYEIPPIFKLLSNGVMLNYLKCSIHLIWVWEWLSL